MANKIKDPLGGGFARLEQRSIQQEKLRTSLTRSVSWSTVRGWYVALCAVWSVAVLLFGVLGLQFSHLGGLVGSQGLTESQWAAAVQVKNDWQYGMYFAVFLGAFAGGRLWNSLRPFLLRLPGSAPHPGMKREIAPGLRYPAPWPPVPVGQPSWTRKISWKIPLATSAGFVLLAVTVEAVDKWAAVSAGKFAELADLSFAGAVLGIAAVGFHLVRLVYLARWARVPAAASVVPVSL